MKRIPALVAASALLLAACGRATGAAGEDAVPGTEEAPSGATSEPTVPGVTFSPQPYVEHPLAQGEPPIWGLSYEETREVEGVLHGFGGGPTKDYPVIEHPVGLAALDAPVGCRPPFEAHTHEGCELPVYAAAGVSQAALDLYAQRQWTIFDVQGTGPVWLASYDDWSRLVGGGNMERHQSIFTPAGIVDPALAASAIDEAVASPLFAAAAAAIKEQGYEEPHGVDDPLDSFVTYGPPVQTDQGWSVPLVIELGTDIASPFAVKVAFDLASDGTFVSTRSLGLCYNAWDYDMDSGEWTYISDMLSFWAPALEGEMQRCDAGELPVNMKWWEQVGKLRGGY